MKDIFYPVAHRTQQEIEILKTRYVAFDENIIPKLFKHILNIDVISWKKPATWSTSHVTYIVAIKNHKSLILRANIGSSEPEVYLVIEKLLTEKIAKLGIPVNKIIYVDVSRKQYPFDFQIQELLEGYDIEDNFHGTRSEYDQLSLDMGRCVGMWGDITFDGFGRFDQQQATRRVLVGTKASMYEYIIVRLDEDIRYLVDSNLLAMSQADSIRKIFEEYKHIMNIEKGTIVHYDLADHNIMFDGSKTITGILDWETAVVGDPVLDLASAPTWKTFFPREVKMLEGYRTVRDLPENFKEKMDIYRLRTMLWKMVYAKRSGILTDDRKKKFDDALLPFKI